MPVEVQWYMAEHVLLARFYGHVSPKDVIKQYEVGLKMSESVDTPLVHLIMDTTEAESFPKDLLHYKDSFGTKAQNAGWVILVGEDKLIRFLSTVVSNLMKLRFNVVNSLDDALEFITARDPYLDIEDALDVTVPYGWADDTEIT